MAYFILGGIMNNNGHTNLEVIQKLVEKYMEASVNSRGEIYIEEVVRLLRKDLDPATIQTILNETGKKTLEDVVTMFV